VLGQAIAWLHIGYFMSWLEIEGYSPISSPNRLRWRNPRTPQLILLFE